MEWRNPTPAVLQSSARSRPSFMLQTRVTNHLQLSRHGEHSNPPSLQSLCRHSPDYVTRNVACCLVDCLLNLRRMAQPGRVPEPSEVSCPQLAAAQWWEAAGRGISCSNYVGCIATLFVIQSMQCTSSIIHLQSLASIFNFGVHFI